MKHTFKNTIHQDIPNSTLSATKAYSQKWDDISKGKRGSTISFNVREFFFGMFRIDEISIDDETGMTDIVLKHKNDSNGYTLNFIFTADVMLELIPLFRGVQHFEFLKSEVQEHSFTNKKDFYYCSGSNILNEYLYGDPSMRRFLALLGIDPASKDKLQLIDDSIIKKSMAILGKYIINKAELFVQEKIKLLATGSSTNEASLAASSSSSSSSTSEVGKELEGSSVVSSLTMFSSKETPEILDQEEQQEFNNLLNRILWTGI